MRDPLKEGGSAFPTPNFVGMTLRQYYAACAMQGMLSQSGNRFNKDAPMLIAQASFLIADAMLKDGSQ